MVTSSIKQFAFACKLLLLVGGLALAPTAVNAATVYIDDDYSRAYNNAYSIEACDYTPGTGTAYSRYGFNDTQTQRLDTQGNPSCEQQHFSSQRVYKHKICQAKLWDDPCSSYVYE